MANARNIGSGQRSPLPNKSVVKTYATIGATATAYTIESDELMIQFLGSTDVEYSDASDGTFVAVNNLVDKIVYVGGVNTIYLKSAADGAVTVLAHSL